MGDERGRALSPTRERGEERALSGKAARGELKKFGESLEKLVESAKEVHRAHATTGGAKLAVSLSAFGERADLEGIEMSMTKLYSQAAGALRQVDGCKQQHLEVGFIQPMETFVRSEMKALAEAEKKLAKAREEFDNAQVKANQSRMKKGDKAGKLETELAETQQRFEMAEVNFMNKAFAVDARKQFEVTERVCDLLLAQLMMHKLSFDILKTIEAPLLEAKQRITESRNNFVSKVAPGRVEEMLSANAHKAAHSNVGTGDASMKQGYVHINGKRRWVIVSDGVFCVYKSWKDMNASAAADVQETVDLKLCSVKKLDPDPKEKDKDRHAFALISPDKTLTADVPELSELDEWLTVIRNGIATQLKKRAKSPVHGREGAANIGNAAPAGGNASPSTVHSITQAISNNGPALALVRGASQANSQCADCSSKDPEWAVFNLGVIVCSDCSGVHRGLGTHVSRVRSLTLDHWEPALTRNFPKMILLLQLLKQFGNGIANEIWEGIAPAEDKLSEIADRAARDRYIQAKYVSRRYVIKGSPMDDEARYAALQTAAKSNEYVTVLRLLAQGADPNKGALIAHLARDPAVSPHMIELLLQNNTKASAHDDKGWTALHYAAKSDNIPAAAVLLRYNASITAETTDDKPKTPAAVATLSAANGVSRLLSGAESPSVTSAAGSPRKDKDVPAEPSVVATTKSGRKAAPFSKSGSSPNIVVPPTAVSPPLVKSPSQKRLDRDAIIQPLNTESTISATLPPAPTSGDRLAASAAAPHKRGERSPSPTGAHRLAPTSVTVTPATPPGTLVPISTPAAALSQPPLSSSLPPSSILSAASLTLGSNSASNSPSTLSPLAISMAQNTPQGKNSARTLVMRDQSPSPPKRPPPKPLPVPPFPSTPPSLHASISGALLNTTSNAASQLGTTSPMVQPVAKAPAVVPPTAGVSPPASTSSPPPSSTSLSLLAHTMTDATSPRKWAPYVNATSPDQIRLVRQKEVAQEGLDVLKQKVQALRADVTNQKIQDDAILMELTKRVRTAKGIVNGEIEGEG